MTMRFPTADGFMLVRAALPGEYRGVDRDPFEATILECEVDPAAVVAAGEDTIWTLYPPGWRRDAYRLFCNHRVRASFCDLPLVHPVEVARQLREIIPGSEGQYEVIACRVFSRIPHPGQRPLQEGGLIGYDIAYPGGDYYSAVKNGLHVNPHPALRQLFGPMLSEFGLFQTVAPITDFIARFKESVPSESRSEFIVVEVREPG